MDAVFAFISKILETRTSTMVCDSQGSLVDFVYVVLN